MRCNTTPPSIPQGHAPAVSIVRCEAIDLAGRCAFCAGCCRRSTQAAVRSQPARSANGKICSEVFARSEENTATAPHTSLLNWMCHSPPPRCLRKAGRGIRCNHCQAIRAMRVRQPAMRPFRGTPEKWNQRRALGNGFCSRLTSAWVCVGHGAQSMPDWHRQTPVRAYAGRRASARSVGVSCAGRPGRATSATAPAHK